MIYARIVYPLLFKQPEGGKKRKQDIRMIEEKK
jgi:hypothetical protein